jgi:hypothetical protein
VFEVDFGLHSSPPIIETWEKMPSPVAAGLYSALFAMLFASAAVSLQMLPDGSGDYHQLNRRDEWDTYDSGLTEFVNSPTCDPGSAPGNGSDTGDMMIAVASYIDPLGSPADWTRLIGYPNAELPIVVANVVNGPDSVVNTAWQGVINQAAGAGKIVLGYVRTGYLGVSQQAFVTRLGSGALADWAAQIEEDVDAWYTLYGSSMGGIFFDEGWPGCGDNNIYHDLYKYINDYTKRKHPGAYTVLNPGSPIDSCFEDTMDTLLTFELNYTSYVSSYTPNNWTPAEPTKLWHIVYNVPESAISQVAALARERGAGFLQMTDETLPNPYNILPSDSYMQAQIAQASGGSATNAPASTWPSGEAAGAVDSVGIGFYDYSSCNLVWPAVQGAFGYNLYSNAELVASVPPTMTTITIGSLQPGTRYAFYAKAIGGGGVEGPQSPTSQMTTLSLPNSETVSNLRYSGGSTSTTYQADILVPYAFVRLYLWDTVTCILSESPAWPINFSSGDYVCAHYMVEGTTLYSYSGTIPAGTTNAPWSWTEVATVPVTVTGSYTYNWVLPLGTSTVDPSEFLVQAQGYNPLTNVYQPNSTAYDCKGSSYCNPGSSSLASAGLCYCAHSNVTRSDTYMYSNT